MRRPFRFAIIRARMEIQDKSSERKRAKKRGNRHGNIYKKGRLYYVRWMVDGQTFKRSLHTANRREAEAEADRVLAAFQTRDRAEVLTNLTARLGDAKEEIRRIEDARPALRLADMFEAFRANPNRPQSGARTLEGYRAQAGRFVAWIAAYYPDAVEVRHVTGEMAAQFLDELARSNSPNTYNKYASLLRLIWRTIGTAARCDGNPWEGVRRKEQPHTNGRRALTVEELRRVCSPLTGETIDAETADAPTDTREGVYEREDGGGCEDVPPDGESRLQAFKAAFSALQGRERAAAVRWVRSQTAKRLK